LRSIATWIRECDEANFERAFRHYPEVRLYNARTNPVPWEQIQGLVLTGGSDISEAFLRQPCPDSSLIEDPDPLRDQWDFSATAQAIEMRIPLLAICRGLQVLNVVLGGTLHLHIPGHDQAKYDNNQKLSYAQGVAPLFNHVNSSHHQALAEVASGLVVEARCEDDQVIEQARLTNYPFALGVQYHPERDGLYQPLFQEFIKQLAIKS
jgi:putative glutamine amidotransferase